MDTLKNLNSNDTLAEVVGGEDAPRQATEYQQFIEWIALPAKEREPKTQKELAERFGLSEWTLSQWKLRDGFWPAVETIRKDWGKTRTPEVLHGLYTKALGGNAAEVKLWFEIVEGFIPKSKSDINATTKDITDEAFTLKLGGLLDELQAGGDTTLKPDPNNNSAVPSRTDFLEMPISYRRYGLDEVSSQDDGK